MSNAVSCDLESMNLGALLAVEAMALSRHEFQWQANNLKVLAMDYLS
jgi:hypothetical protein